jgi:arabinose-5-phosphate isomerase
MLGVTAVVDNEKIIGIITDGDLRRMLSKSDNISSLTAKDIMSSNPRRIAEDAMAVDAKEMMEVVWYFPIVSRKRWKLCWCCTPS